MNPIVKLIQITPNAEETIAYCARVSSKNQENPNYEKLISYCAKKHHWSIFELAHMTLEITTTRAISPQVLRHRSFSYQEYSQRYSNPSDSTMPTMLKSAHDFELRLQDYKNRQNSFELDTDKLVELEAKFRNRIMNLAKDSQDLYDDLIAEGVAKECARNVLLLCVPTRLYMVGNIRSWIHYIQVRADKATQKEHRLIAVRALEILREQVPTVAEALFPLNPPQPIKHNRLQLLVKRLFRL